MRIAEVIGTVTLNRMHPSVAGARWVIGVPYSLQALREQGPPDGEDVVIFDNLGAGNGNQVGFSEGAEAGGCLLRLPVGPAHALHERKDRR